VNDAELEIVVQALVSQGAPASHLARVARLHELCSKSSSVSALCLVGSYAKGCGDRISDLDLVTLVEDQAASAFISSAHGFLSGDEVLNSYAGTHPAGGSFRRYVYLDFSSCELHAFNLPTAFRLKMPYLTVWNPHNVLETVVSDGPSPKHEDFEAYQHGDEGLIWELVDCIKWLHRGRTALAKSYLQKLVAKL
jgi:hypothetical protein